MGYLSFEDLESFVPVAWNDIKIAGAEVAAPGSIDVNPNPPAALVEPDPSTRDSRSPIATRKNHANLVPSDKHDLAVTLNRDC